jgi:hypothetical protein
MSENEESIEKINKEESGSKIEIQLGDIIRIIHPKNQRLDNQEFFIQYIDSQKIFILSPETGEVIKLKISPEGIIGDGNITELILLSRADSASYAIQNDLTPNKWINIHFGGDFPLIITGEITNLENDMIEIKTIDNDILYINFDYKGIPEDIPIDFIEIREKPQETKSPEIEEEMIGMEDMEPIEMLEELQREVVLVPAERIQLGVPTKNIRNQLREYILRADQIQFGEEELGPIRQFVDVAQEKQRYSIDEQVADLLDDLLSTIPTAQRNRTVLNNIHIMIERFKQLRETFSTKDEYGNIDGVTIFMADYKPIISYFKKFNKDLFWILPVVENVKKIYDANMEDVDDELDVNYLHTDKDILDIKNLLKQYESNTEQNKYLQLYNSLNPYFTPFNSVDEENKNSLLIEKPAKCDINVIIDNLDNEKMESMFSYVFTDKKIQTKRFVTQKYITSLTRLNTIEKEGSKPSMVVSNLTEPDWLSIKSFLTLPEPVVRFSKVNLPGTNLLEKASLNLTFFYYWRFLTANTHVASVSIENLNEEIEFSEEHFVNNTKNYILQLTENDKKKMTKEKMYTEFLQKITPKIRVLFNVMKKYINGKLSIVDVVGYLEPFLVYTEDLTYMQYKDITSFIDEKISEYNKNMVERSRILSLIKKTREDPIIFTIAYSFLSILDIKDNFRDEITNNYDLTDNKVFTNSEIYRKFMLKDYNKLYATALSLQSTPLMFPTEFASLFEKEEDKLHKKIENQKDAESCKNMIVAKQYFSKEELEQDNNKVIYFDKKFDKTNYNLLDEYDKDMIKMTPEEFITYLIKELEKKQRLSVVNAEYLAESLIDGHKKVINGQYAILYYGNEINKQNRKDDYEYFVRTNNQWTIDNTIEKGTNTTDPDLLCNLQKKCISTYIPSTHEDKCQDITVDVLSLQSKVMKEVIHEFDDKYRLSKEETEKKLREKLNYFISVMPMITKIETSALLKYSNQKYNLGVYQDEDKPQAPISPYAKVLNIILGQKDFVKKQNDIIRFVISYTRPPILEGFGPLNKKESEYWLYCNKSNVELLPIFRYDMANAFVNDPSNYNNFVEQLITKIGKESDDGDSWTALGSGWTIRKADFDVEEGYEEGFKLVTRAVLEEDAGNRITTALEGKKMVRIETPETRMITNIINALSVAMGINIEIQKEFIINCVSDSMRETIESEEDYKIKVKELAEKGKKLIPYKDHYNSALLYRTLGMFLIAVQTVIPSVKTRKTHPGCIRSFHGFPFEGTGDYSSLTYLACVAYDIRESGEPWNTLKKKKGDKEDVIESKIKNVISERLLILPAVKEKFDAKTDYLLLSPAEKIPDEHDIANWTHFLPPLFPFKIKRLLNIGPEFQKELINDLRNGSSRQREKILVLDSKIIQFSLAIQEKIQNIVKQKQALLMSANQPYLENACCQTKDGETAIGYFIENDNHIAEFNEIVRKLTNILMDITSYTKSGIFYSNINTKNKYPSINQHFDEKNIYLAFIHFCKFKSLIPIPEDLLPLCTDKPEYNFLTTNDSLEEMISKLKENGRNYNNETFLRLLQLIGRNNIININLNLPPISSVTILNNLLETIEDENDEVVEGSLRKKIQNALNTFDIATPEITKDVRELNNYLINSIRSMSEEIVEFIDKNRGPSIKRSEAMEAIDIIQHLSTWSIDKEEIPITDHRISNDAMYNIVQFYKNFIGYFITLFPNIVLNKVDYTNTLIPKYMKLSRNHAGKIVGYIENYYSDLKPFYGNSKLTSVLNRIQTSAKNIERLSQETPCFTTIQSGENILKPVFDERTSKMLYEYYLLRVIINYMDLSDENDMIVNETTIRQDVQDIFSVEYLEERETRVDFTETTKTETHGILRGNQKELRQLVTHLLVAFLNIMNREKEKVDISYDKVRDNIFKLREREKDMITDRLKALTDESREIDTILKINKLGVWSKGLQKGLTTYDKEMYEEEEGFRDEMEKAERNIRKKNSNVTDENIDQYVEDYLEEQQMGEEIEREAYDMEYLNEDFYEGNFDGNDAPEEEGDDYRDYD